MYAPNIGLGPWQEETPVAGVKEIAVQGRGSWVIPILMGAIGFWFLARGRGMRGLW